MHETGSMSKYSRKKANPSQLFFFLPKTHPQCVSTSISVSVQAGFGFTAEVCSVALAFRESNEVFSFLFFFWNSHIVLCILHEWIFFKLSVIPCGCHFASWERRPPEERGQCEVWELLTDEDAVLLDIQVKGCKLKYRAGVTKWVCVAGFEMPQ